MRASAGAGREGKGCEDPLEKEGMMQRSALRRRLTSVAIVEDFGYLVDRKEEAVVREKKVRS